MVYVLRANLATDYAMAKMLFTEGILFMELQDVIKYEANKVFFQDRKQRNLGGLKEEELRAYRYLFENRIRIEQEKISQQDLIIKLRQMGLSEDV